MVIKNLYFNIKNILAGYKNYTRSAQSIRIVKIFKKAGSTFVQMQYIGKASSFVMEAKKIADDKKIFNQLSTNDQSKIIFFSDLCQYELYSIDYDDTHGTLFTIRATIHNKPYFKKYTCNDLLHNKKLLYKLSKEDLFDVTYVLGRQSK